MRLALELATELESHDDRIVNERKEQKNDFRFQLYQNFNCVLNCKKYEKKYSSTNSDSNYSNKNCSDKNVVTGFFINFVVEGEMSR